MRRLPSLRARSAPACISVTLLLHPMYSQSSPLLLTAFAAIVFIISGARMGAAPASPPNVLLIITDDQGYGDLSLHGNPHLQTPHIDRLGRAGVRFDRFYVSSFCAPTRAALLTGRYPERTGVHGVTYNRETMRAEEVTLAEALKAGGYRTACIGKWHNGEHYPHTATAQGFDSFLGFNAGHWNNYFDANLLRGDQEEATRGYITDVLTDEAVQFMGNQAAGAQPFFCYLSYNAPHSPYQVPDRYYDKFAAKGLEPSVAAFYGMCENIDDNVGRLLRFLDEKKLSENTVVIFMTDNGGTAGAKIYNAGMRGQKTSVHEGGSRVPFFIHWPAAKWTAHTVTTLAAHIDIYDTVLDLCAVKPPVGLPRDGRSLKPLLEGSAPAGEERTLFIHNPIDERNRYPGAVRTARYRLVREIPGPAGGSNAKANDARATAWQLYDMVGDPKEQRDIAAAEPTVVTHLSTRYEQWVDSLFQTPLQRVRIPVGHRAAPDVVLQAPQAFFSGSLRFNAGPGFANDWLTSWTSPQGEIWFELEVAQSGTYAVEIAYACPEADAGSRVRLETSQASLEFRVPAAPIAPVELPHRDERGRVRYQNRTWAHLAVGSITLSRGKESLKLRVLAQAGKQVMDFKQMRLTRVAAAAQ